MADKEKPAFDPSEIAEVLTWAMDECDPDQADDPSLADETRCDALTDLLAISLADIDSSPDALTRISVMLQPNPPGNIGGFLQDEASELECLKRIQAYAKQRTKLVLHGPEHEAAKVVYFAAIARAFCSHNQNISKNNSEKLSRSFKLFSNLPWISPPLRELFLQAVSLL
jgi:hypothetical protein